MSEATRPAQQCCAEIYDGGWRPRRCTRPGAVEENGKHYCRQHAPSAGRARREKTEARWRAESAYRDAERAVAARKDAVVAAAQRAARQEASWDAVAEAVAELDAAERALWECAP